jgi:hypothetical protein
LDFVFILYTLLRSVCQGKKLSGLKIILDKPVSKEYKKIMETNKKIKERAKGGTDAGASMYGL